MAKDARGSKWALNKLKRRNTTPYPPERKTKAYRVFGNYHDAINFASPLAKRDKTVLYVMNYSGRILDQIDYRDY